MPGSIPVVVPQPFPDYALDLVWPVQTAAAVNAAVQANGFSRHGGNLAVPIFGAKVGGAAANMLTYKGLYAAQVTSDGVGGTSGFNCAGNSSTMFVPITKNAVATNFLMPEQARVFRVQFLMAQRVAVAYSGASGFIIQATANGAVPGWISTVGSQGFGIVGNGAGGWSYVSKQGGAGFAETVALVWPSAVAEWVVVDYEILGATGVADARFTLYLNGTAILSRSWGAGSLLPDYSNPATAAAYMFAWNCGEAALAGDLCLSGLRFMQGRYRVNGAQV